MEAGGEKTPGSSAQQRVEGTPAHPKTAEEMAQTGRDHGE